MIQKKNGIVVVGAIFVDIKGFPQDIYVPDGRNAGYIEYIHGGVARNVVEDIANLGLTSSPNAVLSTILTNVEFKPKFAISKCEYRLYEIYRKRYGYMASCF